MRQLSSVDKQELVALMQSQQSSDDHDGELSVAAATCNSHSSQLVAVPAAFLDNAQFECDHTRHAASNAAHSCYGQAVCEDPSAQDNRSVAETADLAEAGTCAQAEDVAETALAEATQVRHPETGASAVQAFSLLQETARKELSSALAQLASCITAAKKW